MKTKRPYKLPDYEDYRKMSFTRRELKKFLHRHKNLFPEEPIAFDKYDNPYSVDLDKVGRKPISASVSNVAVNKFRPSRG